MQAQKRMELPDILRGLAVIFMIVIHVLNVYGNSAASHGTVHDIVDFMGGPPAAPVFMFVMGFFILLKRPTPADAFKRGMWLVVLGYGLNFVRGYLPVNLAVYLLGYDLSYFPDSYSNYYLLWNVDILIFAGLAYIAVGLLVQISEHPVFLIAAAVLTAAVSPSLWGVGADVPVLKHILNPIWGADGDLVTFPFFPWVVYPILGAASASLYKRDWPEKRMVLVSMLTGVFLLIGGGILLALDFERFFNDYGQQHWGALIAFSGFVLLWGLLVRWLNRVYPASWRTGLLKYMSRNLTVVYVFQWLIIGWGMLLIPAHSLTFWQVMAGSLVVTALSCPLAGLYRRMRVCRREGVS